MWYRRTFFAVRIFAYHKRFIMEQIKILMPEELENEHISIIRAVARRVGVKAPSTKKKEELIRDIIAIQHLVKPPEVDVNEKRGAPVKEVDISKFYVTPDMPYDQVFVPQDKLFFKDSSKPKSDVYKMTGILETHPQGFGFLRANIYENSSDDVYVSTSNMKKYNLKKGDKIKAKAKRNEMDEGLAAALQEIISINDLDPSLFTNRNSFDDLVPCYPTKQLKLESKGESDLTLRCIDLFSPIGMGQRGLIVAPPKTGKTTLLKKIAQAIEKNYSDVKLFVLLIDERPEEVTDFKRSIKGEVVFSTFDESAEHHVRAAELVMNRAKRLVEVGKNVVILMDSITRLVRAYNTTIDSSGKTLSGGLDPIALTGPKQLFGAARNIERGGSLTILSTALVDTGSRMDDVIYEEFKGTGNMEIHLSRELSEKRIFPAIDLYKSGTRKEELLLKEETLSAVYKLRKILAERSSDATESVLDSLNKTKDNKDFISKVDAWVKLYKK